MLLQQSMLAMSVPDRIQRAIPQHVQEQRNQLEEAMLRDSIKVTVKNTRCQYYRT
jgi:hypothetical protein